MRFLDNLMKRGSTAEAVQETRRQEELSLQDQARKKLLETAVQEPLITKKIEEITKGNQKKMYDFRVATVRALFNRMGVYGDAVEGLNRIDNGKSNGNIETWAKTQQRFKDNPQELQEVLRSVPLPDIRRKEAGV